MGAPAARSATSAMRMLPTSFGQLFRRGWHDRIPVEGEDFFAIGIKIFNAPQAPARKAAVSVNHQNRQGRKGIVCAPVHDMPKLTIENASALVAQDIRDPAVGECLSPKGRADKNEVNLVSPVRQCRRVFEIGNWHLIVPLVGAQVCWFMLSEQCLWAVGIWSDPAIRPASA